MSALLLAAGVVVGCADGSGPASRVRSYQLCAFEAEFPGVLYRTLGTSANHVQLDLAGTYHSGGARLTGEWWAEIVSLAATDTGLVFGGLFEGTYARFSDTLRLDLRETTYGYRHWLSGVVFTGDESLSGAWRNRTDRLVIRFRERC